MKLERQVWFFLKGCIVQHELARVSAAWWLRNRFSYLRALSLTPAVVRIVKIFLCFCINILLEPCFVQKRWLVEPEHAFSDRPSSSGVPANPIVYHSFLEVQWTLPALSRIRRRWYVLFRNTPWIAYYDWKWHHWLKNMVCELCTFSVPHHAPRCLSKFNP